MKIVDEQSTSKQPLLCRKCGRSVEVVYEEGAEYRCSKCGGKMMKAIKVNEEDGYRRRE
jgi:DNA-directed RNA polymerase subunit RPC12/RpoP